MANKLVKIGMTHCHAAPITELEILSPTVKKKLVPKRRNPQTRILGIWSRRNHALFFSKSITGTSIRTAAKALRMNANTTGFTFVIPTLITTVPMPTPAPIIRKSKVWPNMSNPAVGLSLLSFGSQIGVYGCGE